MVESSGNILHFAKGQIELPSVIRLNKFVKIPYRHAVPLSRRAIFARDGGRCVYCAAPATSIDHVIPRSRGGDIIGKMLSLLATSAITLRQINRLRI
jgi:5-methylcytosine-specific restriction endonuclease McrA